ncbi:MAG: hypothetical protein ACI92T_001298 [Pseudoalteromonas distincta]
MYKELNKVGVYMDNNSQTPSRLSLEVKTLIATLTAESFNFRSRVHVNVVTNANDPSISVFIYVDGKCEKSFLTMLNEENAATELKKVLDATRESKRIGTYTLPTLLAS